MTGPARLQTADEESRLAVGRLIEQRHQVFDPAEPPLAVASYAVDVERGFAETPAAWAVRTGTDRSVCGPEPVAARPVVDVQTGGVL